MSGRCKSCNYVLTDDEMVNKWPGTTEYTDMCFSCLSLCNDESEYSDLDFDPDNIHIEDFPESLE